MMFLSGLKLFVCLGQIFSVALAAKKKRQKRCHIYFSVFKPKFLISAM